MSGIDGCTSTAIGAATVNETPTLLITGDMSMQYDLGALATSFIPSTFKIAVLNNGGGGIFRFISSTRKLSELDKCFVADVRLPLAELARGFGFEYFRAASFEELAEICPHFIGHNSSPAILDMQTDGPLSAKILDQTLNNPTA